MVGERDACCLTTDCQRDQQQEHQHHDDGQGTNVVIVCEKSEMLPTLKKKCPWRKINVIVIIFMNDDTTIVTF